MQIGSDLIIATTGLIIAAVGNVMLISQIRLSRKLAAIQFIQGLEDTFFSSPLYRKIRQRCASDLLREVYHKDVVTILDYFETISGYVEEGVVSERHVRESFGQIMLHYWFALKRYVDDSRKADDFDLWAGTEKLIKSHLRYRREQNYEYIIPSRTQILEYLKDEAEMIVD